MGTRLTQTLKDAYLFPHSSSLFYRQENRDPERKGNHLKSGSMSVAELRSHHTPPGPAAICCRLNDRIGLWEGLVSLQQQQSSNRWAFLLSRGGCFKE